MRIVVLTSSRADYGIYLPLLKKLKADNFFDLKIIAFGTHLSRFHGYTVERIEQDGFEIVEKLETLILGDSETAISNAIGNTVSRFAAIWEKLKNQVDLVFALGDRYEMFAAVTASIPFNIQIAHLHGGETTLGAIDNKFRHAITLMSSIHFAATESYCEKIKRLIGQEHYIFNVGALSIENLDNFQLLSKIAFQKQFNIDISIPTILTTFHPETVSIEKNETYTKILVDTFEKLSKDYQIVITMPNADTMGSMIRNYFVELSKKNSKIVCVENFGSLGYFSCIKYCSFLLGNTSSGIIEAASLGKYVINIGDRQKGRARSENVIDVEVDMVKILESVQKIKSDYKGENVYYIENSSNKIIKALKDMNDK
ncbi:MAG: UDP-N-acetylglucosamine 2-epimerase [Saprospiraceae bacterium]